MFQQEASEGHRPRASLHPVAQMARPRYLLDPIGKSPKLDLPAATVPRSRQEDHGVDHRRRERLPRLPLLGAPMRRLELKEALLEHTLRCRQGRRLAQLAPKTLDGVVAELVPVWPGVAGGLRGGIALLHSGRLLRGRPLR